MTRIVQIDQTKYQWPYQADTDAKKQGSILRDEAVVFEVVDKDKKVRATIYSDGCMLVGDKEVAMKAFEKLLATHDKYFEYSDDHSVWRRGQDEFTTIQFMYKKLIERGFKTEVEELWVKYMA